MEGFLLSFALFVRVFSCDTCRPQWRRFRDSNPDPIGMQEIRASYTLSAILRTGRVFILESSNNGNGSVYISNWRLMIMDPARVLPLSPGSGTGGFYRPLPSLISSPLYMCCRDPLHFLLKCGSVFLQCHFLPQ